MEIILTKDQLAIVADRLNKQKTLENELKTEKSLLDSFVLGVATHSGISGDFKYELTEGKLIITQ